MYVGAQVVGIGSKHHNITDVHTINQSLLKRVRQTNIGLVTLAW